MNCEPPGREIGVILKDREGTYTFLPWDHPLVCATIFPNLFPSAADAYRRGTKLNKPNLEEDNEESETDELGDQIPADEEIEEAIQLLNDRSQQQQQMVEEEEMVDEEEEEYLLNAQDELRYSSRIYVSRNQWIRYMMKIDGSDGSDGKMWNSPNQVHWLWWARKLAQFFVLSMNNRISTEKVLWKKSKQKNLKQALPVRLVQLLQKDFERWYGKGRNYKEN